MKLIHDSPAIPLELLTTIPEYVEALGTQWYMLSEDSGNVGLWGTKVAVDADHFPVRVGRRPGVVFGA